MHAIERISPCSASHRSKVKGDLQTPQKVAFFRAQDNVLAAQYPDYSIFTESEVGVSTKVLQDDTMKYFWIMRRLGKTCCSLQEVMANRSSSESNWGLFGQSVSQRFRQTSLRPGHFRTTRLFKQQAEMVRNK